MALYLAKFNWKGELHTFFTNSSSIETAFKNAITRLAKKVGYSYLSIYNHFISGVKENYSINLIRKKEK